jgi:hypothetical protein
LVLTETERVYSALALVAPEDVFVFHFEQLHFACAFACQQQLAILSELQRAHGCLEFEQLALRRQFLEVDVVLALWLGQRVEVDSLGHADSQRVEGTEGESCDLHVGGVLLAE